MYRRFIWLLLLLAALLFLSGCRHLPGNGKAPQPSSSPPMPSSPLVTLSFNESASYFKRIQGYEFRSENGKHTAYFYMANAELAHL